MSWVYLRKISSLAKLIAMMLAVAAWQHKKSGHLSGPL